MTTTTTTVHDRVAMRDRMHVPRSRGAGSGLLLVLLGVWGGLVPFLGPVFGYSFTPDDAWNFSWARFWLDILPAAATVLGGLWLMGSSNRISGWVGGWIAAAGGAWFVIGQTVSRLWNDGVPAGGSPAASTNLGQVVEQIGFFTGLGAVIVLLAGMAIGRLSVVGVRDLRHLESTRNDIPAQRTASVAEADRAEGVNRVDGANGVDRVDQVDQVDDDIAAGHRRVD